MCKYLPKESKTLGQGVTSQLVNVMMQTGHSHCRSTWTVHHTLNTATLTSDLHNYQSILQQATLLLRGSFL